MYDSSIDAHYHIYNIQWVWANLVRPALDVRFDVHDQSKLEPPEKECYDKYIPLLKKYKFGTPEYNQVKEAMRKEGMAHHIEVNRHHPEHFKNGISNMNLIDLVEHILDCYAASMNSDTGFDAGMQKNAERFHYPKELQEIIHNTSSEVFKGQKPSDNPYPAHHD